MWTDEHHGRYILNDAGEPEPCEDLKKWALWMETGNRRIALDQVGDYKVSTVFLGLDHAYYGGPPLLYETMVFKMPSDESQLPPHGRCYELSGFSDRYSTRAEALAGHAEILAKFLG